MSKRRLKVYDNPEFVEIEFIDCQSGLISGWAFPSDIKKTPDMVEPFMLTTRGWLIAEDRTMYAVAHNLIGPEGHSAHSKIQVSNVCIVQKGPGTTLTYIDIKGD